MILGKGDVGFMGDEELLKEEYDIEYDSDDSMGSRMPTKKINAGKFAKNQTDVKVLLSDDIRHTEKYGIDLDASSGEDTDQLNDVNASLYNDEF